MSPKIAQRAFIGLNMLACLAVGYLLSDIYRVEHALQQQPFTIRYNSGLSFLSLSSIFWLFSLIQFLGLRNSDSIILRHANAFIVAWFIATLIISYSIPQLQKSRFEKASYIACDNPKSISRVSRGKSLIYVKLNDNQLASLPDGAREKHACQMLAEIAD